MRPTRRAIVLAILGLPVALLPAAVDARLWALWPVYLGGLALALGVDALMAPRAAGGSASVAMTGTLSIDAEAGAVSTPGPVYSGEEEEAVLTVAVPSARPVPVTVAVDLSDRLVPQPQLRGRGSQEGMGLPVRLAGPPPGRPA